MNPVFVAIYDKKAQAYLHPFVQSDLATAERSYCAFLASGDSTPAQWPDDFDLYHVGDFDPRSGLLISLQHPALVITGQSAMLAAHRLMRQRGSELSRGVTPSEDSAADDSAERNKTPSDVSSSPSDYTPSLGL